MFEVDNELPEMEVFVKEVNLEILRKYEGRIRKLKIDLSSGAMEYSNEAADEDLEKTVVCAGDRKCYGVIYGIIGVFKAPPSDLLCLLG